MSDLRRTAAELGWQRVETYIQSGNVVFDAAGDEHDLASALASALSEHHENDIKVVVRSADEIARIAGVHPDADGDIESRFLHVHLLDRTPVAPEGVSAELYVPDRWVLVGREIYVTYPNGSGRSHLTIEVFERAWGVVATGRNLNTIRKLAELAAG